MALAGQTAARQHAPGISVDLTGLLALRHDARNLKLDLGRGVRGVLAGHHRARFRGRSMDYAESRHYVPGDDIRRIDWRVTARTGKTHTKLFTEERERPLFVLLDFSSHMYFGTRQTLKTVLAARVAALIIWTAALHKDRTGGVVINDCGLRDCKPRSGRRGVLPMLQAIAEASAELPPTWHPSRLNAGLRHLSAVVHPGSLVFLFSDYYGMDNDTHKHLATLARHNDVVACQLSDPLELTPPTAGRYRVSDGAGHYAHLDSSTAANQQHFQNHVTARIDRIQNTLHGFGIPVIHLCNGQDPIRVLRSHFRY